MNKHRLRLLLACLISIMLVLSGCSSDSTVDGSGTNLVVGQGDGTTTGILNEDGIDTGIAATATTVAGKVTLSSIISAKAQQKAAVSSALKYGKLGSNAYNKALSEAAVSMKIAQERALPSRAAGSAFSNGIVELYNASRPGWIYPVATATTDAEGNYTLETLINADKNGNHYEDGGLIPGGNYTLLAYTIHPKTKRPYLVALQSVVSEFAGSIAGVDLEAQTSNAEPKITTMLGVAKNQDGTQTWGDAELILAPNAAIQVAFSMPMNRVALTDLEMDFASVNGSTIPEGTWTLSADWLTATYYLKDGQLWTTGDTYTLTVHGADTTIAKAVDGFTFTGEELATYNVFGKSLKLTGVGTFTVPDGAVEDTQSPTAQLSSPTLAQTSDPIEITTPIRIASNERMDVNGLHLRAEPSLGAQPGVLFVGKNDDDLFEYEFLLGKPLKLDTTYNATVSGGKDLAGNEMNSLTVSFRTVPTTEGVIAIDENSTAEEIATAEAQADVKDVFGKWVRAFNDRNLPQLQSLMTGDFVMEYNAVDGFDENDINRDAMHDLQEFSLMISESFVFWDYCGVEITGNIVDTINIVGSEADFEFKLTATTEKTSQECKEAAPEDSLFATLEKVNGAWYIKRASDGIDTRGQEIVQANLLELVAPENGGEPLLIDDQNAVTFEWVEVTDVASYAWIIIDSRNPRSGFALILPPTMTSIDIPTEIDTLIEAGTVADISEDFGFTDEFEPRDGSELYWQVAALGGNTVRDVNGGRQTDLPKDVIAISELYRFKIAGEYQELSFAVEVDGVPVKFSEMIRGFDVGDAAEVTIKVTTPRANVTHGVLIVDGNTHKKYELVFDEFGVGTTAQPIQLNQGVNHIGAMDGVPCWASDSCTEDSRDDFVEDWFQIITTGGIPPIISINESEENPANGLKSVNADGVVSVEKLVNDGWNFYESADAVAIQVTGTINCLLIDPEVGCANLHEIRYNVWNDEQHASSSGTIDFNKDTGDFSEEIEIYLGENWVGIQGYVCNEDFSGTASEGGCQDFNANFGVKTGVGSVFVPPFQDIVVTEGATDLVQKENWGSGGNWAATGDQVVITGVMEYGVDSTGEKNAQYDIGSDGGWQSDRLFVDPADGSFELIVDLYDGHNYVNLRDVKDNWYNLNIYTEGGKAVIRPEITMVDGVDYAGGDVETTQCEVNIKGTAMEGQMYVYWNASGELKTPNANEETFVNYWMEEKLDVGSDRAFEVTMPLIGGVKYNFSDNFIDVFDNNWNWMGVRVMATGDCEFIPPKMEVTGAKTVTNVALVGEVNLQGNGGNANFRAAQDWNVVLSADQVVLEGTYIGNVSSIKIDPQCGPSFAAPVNENDTWSATVDVYDGFNSFNLTDGQNWWWVNVEQVDASPDRVPSPPVSDIEVKSGTTAGMNHYNGCSNSDWEFDSTTEVSEVTITGVAAGSAGMKGEYQYDGGQGQITFDTTGAFSITVPVFQGNNHIGINDADWNFMGVNIHVMNGPERPRYVSVDWNPSTTAISGTIYKVPVDGNGQPVATAPTFEPNRISVMVNESNCVGEQPCEWGSQEYTNDPNGSDWGAMPMELVGPPNPSGDYTFTINHTFTMQPDRLNIWVDGETTDGEATMWANHGLDMPLCTGCGETYSWKPGAKSKASQHNNPIMLNRLKALNARGK